jgi:hypothetical protein
VVVSTPRYLGVFWILLVLVVVVAAGPLSVKGTLLAAVGATMPPLIMLALQRQHRSPLTIAQVLHDVERQ